MFRSQRKEGYPKLLRSKPSPSISKRGRIANPFWNRLAVGGAFETGGPRLQAKLFVGPANDQYEREADRIAENMMRGQDSNNSVSSELGIDKRGAFGPGDEQKGSPHREDGKPVRAKKNTDSSAVQSPESLGTLNMASASDGRPLPSKPRSFFESRFGRDFGRVRIHTGKQAASISTSLGARAFTVGSDIAFAPGQYRPETNAGKSLIAHELAHVVQQSQSSQLKNTIQRDNGWDLPSAEDLWRYGVRQAGSAERWARRQWMRGERLARGAASRGRQLAEDARARSEPLRERAEQEMEWLTSERGDIQRIDFNGSQVDVVGTPSTSYSAPAVSGLMSHHPVAVADGRDYTDPQYQDVPDKGPIPEGNYYIIPSESESNPPVSFSVGAWGRHRSPLRETVGTEISRMVATSRTGGFYLHEDANHNGTAGCIGIANAADNAAIHQLIRANEGHIPVHVSYP